MKKIALTYKGLYEDESLAKEILSISLMDFARNGTIAGLMVAGFEILMLLRVLLVGLGSTQRNMEYTFWYVFLLAVSITGVLLIKIWSKDMKNNSLRLYHVQVMYAAAITLWACAITLLDARYHDYFDITVYMTILLIIPVMVFVNPLTLALINLFGDIPILFQLLRLGYVSTIINFTVYACLSMFAMVIFQKNKRKLYLKQYELHEKSIKDPLTGILNRQFLHDESPKKWPEFIDEAIPVSFIMADIDFFKSINDTYGHTIGDACIVAVAKAIQSICDKPHYTCYRYGGEEFLVILPSTDGKTASKKANELMEKVRNIKIDDVPEIKLTVSLGVYTATPDEGSKIEHFLSKADELLYQSKEHGRNQSTCLSE